MTKIRFYGRAGASLGREVEFALPEDGCTVAELRRALAERHPDSGAELGRPGLRACVGDSIVGEDHVVRDGDEVEFFPPLSGG